jgi:hypothetical protein
MFGDHFYHGTIRRFVSVFGSLFNDIKVVKSTGTSFRVPLAYGPKEKFLARLDQQPSLDTPKIAIKLPRMSFEILNIAYDTQSKLNRNNRILVGESLFYTYAPYNVSLSLSVMAKNQDDALQILEQIVPYFQPEYTVTVKESVSDLLKTDIPITLSSIDMSEDYEGDFMSRRAIIYTLSFDAKVRFYGPDRKTGVIKRVIVKTLDIDTPTNGFEIQTASVRPIEAQSSDSYEIVEEVNYYNLTPTAEVTLFPSEFSGNGIDFVIGETVVGVNSGSNGIVASFDGNELRVTDAKGFFNANETLRGVTSSAERMVESSVNYYY